MSEAYPEQKRPIIGLFGGTFNPIHHGHLTLAQSVLDALHCSQIRFLPAALPPHKTTPKASATDRAAMVQLAIHGYPKFVLDPCELERTGPSYTIDTLRNLRKQLPEAALCLMIGQDSYANLRQWHEWQALMNEAHLLVVHRAHFDHRLELHAEHVGRYVPIQEASSMLASQTHGFITYLNDPPPDISSTEIRHFFQHPHTQLDIHQSLPEAVISYIHKKQLYL